MRARPPRGPEPADGVIPIHRPTAQDRAQQTTSYVGMTVFVASWAMLFAALFMSYTVLRIRSPMWPPAGQERLPLGLPLCASVLLALSSAALQRGLVRVRRGETHVYLRHLIATAALGAAFLLLQSIAWWSLWQGGLTIRSGLYGGVFYLLTCFHALHVAVGILFLLWLLPAAHGHRDLCGKLGRLGVVTVYWHFVGVVWGVMLFAVYLV